MALKSGRVGIHPSQVDPITGMLLSSPGGTTDYTQLTNKPQINSVTLSGNKSLSDLGIATSLSDLQDVTITDPQDGAYLIYDSTNHMWVNTTTPPAPVVPEGSTVTPTDDIQTWLACAGITDKTYTTLAEVLNDSTTLLALISSNNASDYLVRSTSFATASGLVPTMTSATAPSGTVISSGDYSVTYASWKAFDGNDSTNWASTSPAIANTTYIGYKFTESVTAQYLKIKQSATNFFKKYKVQGSNDGFTSDIHDLTDAVTELSAGSLSVVRLTNPIACQDYRVLCLEPSIANDNVAIYTIQLYYCAEPQGICDNSTAMTDIGANDYCANTLLSDSTWCTAICNSTYFESVLTVKVPTMTSNTTPSGVAFASAHTDNDGGEPYKAFDGSIATTANAWATLSGYVSGEYVGYQFPSAVAIKKVVVTNRKASPSYGIKNFKIQGSNDGITYTDILTDIMSSDASEYSQSFVLASNSTARQYHRVYCVDGYNNSYLRIGELQFYGRQDI